jgi:ElaB/YqjD/DUF883 family membrane-anchored ribosome-binding protein
MMIQITRQESLHDGTSQPSPGRDHGEFVDPAQKRPSRIVRAIERFVAQRPGFCLGTALSVGIALGWWVKRQ